MIGNDVVDLRQAEMDSNWQRTGYLSKICTIKEQQLILQAPRPSIMLWLIWTMKEAACKIVQRTTGVRCYVPLSYSCEELHPGDLASGQVRYRENIFPIRSEIKGPLIHSVAVSNTVDFEHLHLHYLNPVTTYKEEFNNLSTPYLLTRTSSGLPEMIHTITGQRHAVSVSHHGNYLAVIYSDSLLLTN